jgi:hypothetical protein
VNGVYLEQRMIHSSTSLTKDLSRHLFARRPQGRVAILTDSPIGLHAALRKQWMVLLRQVQRERSSTLKAARILVLSDQIQWMQRVSFTCAAPSKKQADIYIMTAQDYARSDGQFEMLYLTDDSQSDHIASQMQQGILVTYHIGDDETPAGDDGES